MKYCTDCIEGHTEECFLRTAQYCECCPGEEWTVSQLPYRMKWVCALRNMAQYAYKPEFQQLRNMVNLCVSGATQRV